MCPGISVREDLDLGPGRDVDGGLVRVGCGLVTSCGCGLGTFRGCGWERALWMGMGEGSVDEDGGHVQDADGGGLCG